MSFLGSCTLPSLRLRYSYLTAPGSFSQFFPAFEKEGFYDWKAKAAGQQITVRVTPDMFEEFVAYDTTFVNDQNKFPNVSLPLSTIPIDPCVLVLTLVFYSVRQRIYSLYTAMQTI